jgi:diguanylate cyclase (GGDEF)-like protein/PAS domain S-box-containing protein
LRDLNARAREVFQIDSREALGKSLDAFFVHPADRWRFVETLDSHRFVQQYEALMNRSSGARFWASLNARRVPVDREERVLIALSDISQRKRLENRLRQAADYDDLTGLHSRRHFDEVMERERERADRYEHPTCLMMIDLDRFKEINDQFGHPAGDLYLRRFADTCRKLLRSTDVMGRVGGEEFAVLLPETKLEEAEEIAERIRHTVADLHVNTDGQEFGTSVSIGVVTMGPGESVQCAIARADRALYQAKAAGRNAVRTESAS